MKIYTAQEVSIDSKKINGDLPITSTNNEKFGDPRYIISVTINKKWFTSCKIINA